jgi:hypothetical protein
MPMKAKMHSTVLKQNNLGKGYSNTVADISIAHAFPNQEIALICLFLGTNLHENYMLECTGIWAIQKQQF